MGTAMHGRCRREVRPAVGSVARPHWSLDKKTPDEFYFASLPALPKAA